MAKETQRKVTRPDDRRLFQQLSAPSPHIEPPAMYTFSVLMSLSLLLVLPMVYLGIVGGLGWITWELISTSGRLFSVGHVVLPVVLGFGGLIALLMFVALIKPLVSWVIEWLRAKDTQIVISRDEEPLLYAVVDQLSDTLETPRACEIRVTADVNASAGPRSIIGGLFRENTVLTIGLTLASGMTVRQFLGVVAHELGHFSQSGGGTELTTLVRLLNSWLGNLAMSRDVVDDYLEFAARRGVMPLRVALWLPMLCVTIARRLMELLLVIGHAASCYEARHKEFDADQFEAYVAGSNTFHDSTMRLRILAYAYSKSIEDLRESWQERRISNDLPTLVAANAEAIDSDREKQIQRLALTEKSAWHETHPSDAERIAAVKRKGLPGIVHDDRPASVLFKDLPALNQRVTNVLLKEMLEDEFDPSQMVPVQDLIRELQEKDAALAALRRYFQGEFVPARPIWPDTNADQPPQNAQKTLEQLKSARKAMLAESETVHQPLREYDEVDTKLLSARQAQVFSRTGFWIDPVSFDLDILDGSPESVDIAVKTYARQQREMNEQLKTYDHSAQTRLTCALRLLQSRAVQKRLPEATRDHDLQAARKLVKVCQQLHDVHPLVSELRMQTCGLAPLSMIDRRDLERPLQKWIDDHHRVVAGWIDNVKNSLAAIEYPFDHWKGKVTAADYVLPEKSAKPNSASMDPMLETLELAAGVLDRYMLMLIRVLARVTLVAERVETAIGFKPLIDPTADDPLDPMEAYIRKAENEALKHPSLAARVQGATRWAVQFGATLILVLLLVGGFAGIVALARAKNDAFAEFDQFRSDAVSDEPTGANDP